MVMYGCMLSFQVKRVMKGLDDPSLTSMFPTRRTIKHPQKPAADAAVDV